MLGRVVHYGVDAVLFSALLAGIKRSAGLTPDVSQFPDGTARSVAEKYLGVGEFIYDSTVAAAHASRYFESTRATSMAPLPSPLERFEKPEPKQSGGGWFK